MVADEEMMGAFMNDLRPWHVYLWVVLCLDEHVNGFSLLSEGACGWCVHLFGRSGADGL